MKWIAKCSEWLWHTFFEKPSGLQCFSCLSKKLTEETPTKEQDKNKKRYGCPQDFDTTEEFIKSL